MNVYQTALQKSSTTKPNTIASFRWKAAQNNVAATRFLSFQKARKEVRSLNLQGQKEWVKYCASGLKPANIPSNPSIVYKEWNGISDWIGNTDGKPFTSRYRTFLSFTEARRFVKTLGLRTITEWKMYCRSGRRPINIPARPETIYLAQWKSWNHFLGCKKATTGRPSKTAR